MDELIAMFGSKEWFHSVGHDQYGRLVVYIKRTTHETLNDIPDRVNGKQVMVHFASSLTASRSQFTEDLTVRKPAPVVIPEEPISEVELPPVDLSKLTDELDSLEKVCGSHILQDIFYEIHDGDNAVTNLSVRFPQVRSSLVKLYDEYGFDIIYEELDG